mmetsp:Transcript_20395/g.40394  ORF Transcript_20395/g.40394 Transcript_20395/m.40394 type:complete len:90 (+) Transcript_20395:1708-1977(+)
MCPIPAFDCDNLRTMRNYKYLDEMVFSHQIMLCTLVGIHPSQKRRPRWATSSTVVHLCEPYASAFISVDFAIFGASAVGKRVNVGGRYL